MPVSPFQAATDVLDRAEALLALDAPPLPMLVREDIRRMAWAMGVAAIDTQLHWLIRRVDLGGTLPGALAKLPVTLADLVETGKVSVENRREDRLDRPQTRARNVMNEVILRKTFQSADQVQEALSMIGLTKAYPSIAAVISPSETATSIKEHLNKLTHRRNAIVHEGDLSRLMRPQNIKRGSITAAEVRVEIDWVRGFVLAVDAVS